MGNMVNPLSVCSSPLKYKLYCNNRTATDAYLYTIRNIKDSLIYICLYNGKSFWYYMKNTGNHVVKGYIWKNNRWIYRKIKICDIMAYY